MSDLDSESDDVVDDRDLDSESDDVIDDRDSPGPGTGSPVSGSFVHEDLRSAEGEPFRTMESAIDYQFNEFDASVRKRDCERVAKAAEVLLHVWNSTPEVKSDRTPVLVDACTMICASAGPIPQLTDIDAVVRANARARIDAPDGKDRDLWTLEAVNHASPFSYKFDVPTIIPPNWQTPVHTTQQEYTNRFAVMFPQVMSILPIRGVVVCGSAAAWPMGSFKRPSDVDLFVVETPGVNLWDQVHTIVDKLTKYCDLCLITEVMMPGLVVLKINQCNPNSHGSRRLHHGSKTGPIKIQIILRAYKGVSSILHGFDVPSCCVAFDGETTYFTSLSAMAHVSRLNLVVPAYRSLTFEARLAKYMDYGFGLILPEFGQAWSPGEHVLPRMTITVREVQGLLAVGTVAPQAGTPSADYEKKYLSTTYLDDDRFSWFMQRRYINSTTAKHAWINLSQLLEDRMYVLFGRSYDNHTSREHHIPFYKYVTHEPTLDDILPKTSAYTALASMVRRLYHHYGQSSPRCAPLFELSKIFGLDEQAVGKILIKFNRQRPGTERAVSLRSLLQPHADRVYKAYLEAPRQIEWWIRVDPTRQHTAAVNPAPASPQEWYGATHGTPLPPRYPASLDLAVRTAYPSPADHADYGTMIHPCGHAVPVRGVSMDPCSCEQHLDQPIRQIIVD